MKAPQQETRGALLSDCGLYRYALWRHWDARKLCATFVLCNPSTADAQADDPTIRRLRGFAVRWGCGSLHVLNVCAFRATQPAALLTAADPRGPRNDAAIHRAFALASSSVLGPVVFAWGDALPRRLEAHAAHVIAIARREGVEPMCLGRTDSGRPRHPLYVPYTRELEPFQ